MTTPHPVGRRLVRVVLAATLSSAALAAPASADATPAGVEPAGDHVRWARHQGQGAGFHDYGNAVTASDDAIYVAASSESADRAGFAVLRYSHDGSLDWATYPHMGADRRGEATDIAMLADGAVVVNGYTSGFAATRLRTVVLEPDGSVRWSRSKKIATRLGLQFAPKLDVGPTGTIYVAGSTGERFLAMTYGPDGERGWTRRLDVVPDEPDAATSIVADAAGNAYLTGPVGGGFGGIETLRVRPSGKIAWRQHESGAFGSTLGPSFVALTPDGRVVVTGVTESGCGVFAATTWSLDDRHGTRDWLSTYPEDPCDSMEATGMAVRADGSVVVVGSQLVAGSLGFDGVVVSYAPDGTEEWFTPYGPGGSDLPTGIVVHGGTTYVTGATDVAVASNDLLTGALDRDGEMLWLERYDSGSSSERPTNLVLVPGGNLATTGYDYRPGPLEDVLTVSYRR